MDCFSAVVVFNSGLILGGVMLLLTAFSLIKQYKDIFTRIGFLIVGFSAIFLTLIGILSENFGYAHYVVSVGFFLTFPFAMWTIGLSWLRFASLRWFCVISLLLPFVSFYLWNITFTDEAIWTGVAIPEMATAATLIVWLLIIVYLNKIGRLMDIT